MGSPGLCVPPPVLSPCRELALPTAYSPAAGLSPSNLNAVSLMFRAAMTGEGTPGLEELLYSIHPRVPKTQVVRGFPRPAPRCPTPAHCHALVCMCVCVRGRNPDLRFQLFDAELDR